MKHITLRTVSFPLLLSSIRNHVIQISSLSVPYYVCTSIKLENVPHLCAQQSVFLTELNNRALESNNAFLKAFTEVQHLK